jgi:hypothetical protein
VNWTTYWISAGVVASLIAIGVAWQTGQDPKWKESNQGTDMALALIASALAGALWPLTAIWFVLVTINDRARNRARRKNAERWLKEFEKNPRARFVPPPKGTSAGR